jgi:hypothetical protein
VNPFGAALALSVGFSVSFAHFLSAMVSADLVGTLKECLGQFVLYFRLQMIFN